jgi:hypothetical protein
MQQVTEIDAFPRGSRILHIGPPKTGTTAVQSSLFRRQADLSAYGVAYPGRRRHERAAVSAVSLKWVPDGYPADIEKQWEWFVGAVRSSTADRVIVSSEIFSLASDPRITRIVEDLGGPGLQVVITMRPLARMLSSQWQQSIQNLEVADFATWLDRLVGPGAVADPYTDALWHHYRVDRLVRRWGIRVGEENVTLVVLDPDDRSMLLGTFERLLGLPADFLEPAPDEKNVSMPYPEVEMLRAFNRRFRAEGHDRGTYVRAIRGRAMRQIKATAQPTMRAHPIATPAWAVERANLVAAEMAEAITASGARVIGDLAHLLTPVPDDEPSEVPTSVDVQSAAEIAYAMFVAGRASARPRKRRPSPPEIDQLAGRDLVRALMGRVSARLRPGKDRPVRD